MAKRALDTLATIVTRFGAKSVNLLVFLIVARQLSLAEMAAYGFIFSTTLIYSTILDLGTRNSLAVFIGKEPALTHDYTRSGFFLWLELPEQMDALKLFHMALAQGISIAPGPIFSPTRRFGNCIRLNYGSPWTDNAEGAMRTLGRIVHSS